MQVLLLLLVSTLFYYCNSKEVGKICEEFIFSEGYDTSKSKEGAHVLDFVTDFVSF